MAYKDYYIILGVPSNATLQEIKAAYRKLSMKFHPDHNAGDEFFTERFRDLQEAYEILGNLHKRQAYDFNYRHRNFSEIEKDIKVRENELETQRKAFKKWERELKQKEEEIDLKTDRKIMIYALVAVAVLALIIFFATRVSEKKDKDELPAILESIDTSVGNKPPEVSRNKIKLKDGHILIEYQNGFYFVSNKTRFDKILNGKWTGKCLELDNEQWRDILFKGDPKNDTYEIEYPSAGCTGTWSIRDVSDSSIEFKETILTGKGGCKDQAIIRLEEVNESKLLYKSYWPDTANIKASGMINK